MEEPQGIPQSNDIDNRGVNSEIYQTSKLSLIEFSPEFHVQSHARFSKNDMNPLNIPESLCLQYINLKV